jgi:hypothetical protein
MHASQRPYFLWDYDLTVADVQAILSGTGTEQKAWIIARILESARYEDVWKFISLVELREIFPKLQLKPQVRGAWEFALKVWTAESSHGS